MKTIAERAEFYENKIKTLKYKEMKKLYKKCNKSQQTLFNRMYISIDEIPESKIDWAIVQLERTIDENKRKKYLKIPKWFREWM